MFIYKITNKLNGKVYIGQTIRAVSIRFSKHCNNSRKTIISSAIKKYGKDNFIIEEIDGANSQSELNYKEWLWICKSNSLAPNGYNAVEKSITQTLSREARGKISVANKGRTHSLKSRHNMSKGSIGQKSGMLGRRHASESNARNAISNGAKPFVVKNNNHIVWSGLMLSECAKELSLSIGNISQCLHGKRKTHKGYVFTYI